LWSASHSSAIERFNTTHTAGASAGLASRISMEKTLPRANRSSTCGSVFRRRIPRFFNGTSRLSKAVNPSTLQTRITDLPSISSFAQSIRISGIKFVQPPRCSERASLWAARQRCRRDGRAEMARARVRRFDQTRHSIRQLICPNSPESRTTVMMKPGSAPERHAHECSEQIWIIAGGKGHPLLGNEHTKVLQASSRSYAPR
jgi:hypothetical protein